MQENLIVVYEIITKIFLLEGLSTKRASTSITYFVDSVLVQDHAYRDFHVENKLKGYTTDLLYPMEKDGKYKKHQVYNFRIRTLDKNLARYFVEKMPNHTIKEMKGIVSELRKIPKRNIEKLYTITPVILKTQDHCYWKECLSFEEYEEQLKKNLWKKYRYFTGKEADESLPIWDDLKFKNEGVIPFPYKNITLPGDKVEIQVADNQQAQDIAYMVLATGLGDLNSRGASFMGYRYKKI